MVIKKCLKCGAIVEVLKDCTCDNCGVRCCGEQMVEMVANSVDASVEKHKPQVMIVGDMIEVVVPHVMEDAHYIEWIALESAGMSTKINLKPGDATKVEFPYVKGSRVYAYCNLHGLWETIVE